MITRPFRSLAALVAFAVMAGTIAASGCSKKNESPVPIPLTDGPMLTGEPCASNGDCPSGQCQLFGDGGICLAGCASTAACTPGWVCAAAPGQTEDVCQCAPSGAEVCDGKDNDCNAVVDDEPAADQSCQAVIAGEVCQGGGCVCVGQLCNGACAHTDSDPANCGGCGVACAGTCSAGHCLITLAPAQDGASGIALDAASVYWTTAVAGGSVQSVPIGGGSPRTLATGLSYPFAVAVDATNAYWTNSGDGSVMQVALAGAATPVALAIGQDDPNGIGVEAGNVYWTDFDGEMVMTTPVGGGTGTPVELASTGAQVPPALALDATNAYVIADDFFGTNGVVLEIPLDGSPAVTLAQGQSYPQGIAIDAANVYWTNSTGGTVMTTTIAPSGVLATLATGQSQPSGIAVDGTNIYWTNVGDGTVVKAPLGGGAPTVLASGQPNPTAIAVDAAHVYWTNAGNGTPGTGAVMSTPK